MWMFIEKGKGEQSIIMNVDVYDDDGLDDSRTADVTAYAGTFSKRHRMTHQRCQPDLHL